MRQPAAPLFERLGYSVVVGLTAKLLVDITVQMYNPFLPVFAGGMGIGIVTLGRLVGLRNGMGLLAPLFGSLADRIGHRVVMQAGLFLAGIGCILIALNISYPILVISMMISGLGVSIYTPNLHAFISSKLDYGRRSRIMGIVEFSWALAGILGLSLSGILIERFAWNTPFYVIGAGMFAYILIYSTVPRPRKRDKKTAETIRGETRPLSAGAETRPLLARFIGFFKLGENARSAWADIAVTALCFFAVTHILITHGAWLKAEYNVSPSKIGFIALIMGCFDLAASMSVSFFGDRIGKRRSVTIGLIGAVIGFAVLPFLNVSLSIATVSIIIPRFFFEFAIVSNFPLLSEQVPEQRGKVLSLSVSFGLLGGTIAGITGPLFYQQIGVWGLGPISCAAALTALILVRSLVEEKGTKTMVSR